ncbi:hypothetical protein Tco_0735806, partial [Tanacetum coccineum]
VEINPFAPADLAPFVNIFAPDPSSEACGSLIVNGSLQPIKDDSLDV